MKLNKKNNAWHGYTGFKGTELNQTESELYDDIPSEDQKTLMLKVLAGGQIAEERRRAAYYDTEEPDRNPEDIEEVDAGSAAEDFDYVTAYRNYVEEKQRYWRMAHHLEPEQPKQEAKEPEAKKEPEASE